MESHLPYIYIYIYTTSTVWIRQGSIGIPPCPAPTAPRVQTRGWLIQKLAATGFVDDGSSDVPRVYWDGPF